MLIILAGMLLSGCTSEITASEEETSLEEMELLVEIETEEDYMEQNILFFMEQLGLSESRARGAAQTIEEAGCGLIVGYENKIESQRAYGITLINSEGDKFETDFSLEGYMGPIKDENGNYLYYTVD